MEVLKTYAALLRVKHYIKNVLVFLPLFFSGDFFSIGFGLAILAFISFCSISSAIYILNDIEDVEKDRKHHKKRNRPIASGKISVKKARTIFFILLAITVVINIFLTATGAGLSFLIIIIYFALNWLYSKGLKNKPIIDIIILVSGFVLRILYGSFVTRIDISSLFYLTIIAGSFYLGLGKRRNELGKNEENKSTREVLRYYSFDFLDKNMYMCMGLTITFYSLWCLNMNNKFLLATVPVILLIALRYSYDVENNISDGDPTEVIYKDRVIWVLAIIYFVYLCGVLYIGR